MSKWIKCSDRMPEDETDVLVEIDEAVGSKIVEMSGDYFINIGHDTKKNYRLRGIM